ncbi:MULTISPECIES: hypothetical protein [Streptomyces]|uniref:hypothetical protein n=1 Tax=Streptomyces TaxID=1883 RepID=UPI0018FEF7F0|nr:MULTISPECIES: hypothetical protein [Streptomyces]
MLESPARRGAAADLIARITKAYAYVRVGREEGFEKITAATHQPLTQARKDLVDPQKQRPTRARPVGDEPSPPIRRSATPSTELAALKEHLDVKSFWTTALDADLKKAL